MLRPESLLGGLAERDEQKADHSLVLVVGLSAVLIRFKDLNVELVCAQSAWTCAARTKCRKVTVSKQTRGSAPRDATNEIK